jgi:hypothetical protein
VKGKTSVTVSGDAAGISRHDFLQIDDEVVRVTASEGGALTIRRVRWYDIIIPWLRYLIRRHK